MLSNFSNKKNEKDAAWSAPAVTPSPAVTAAPSVPPPLRPGERVAPSIIGPDLTIIGNLVSRGEVQIDGEVQGDIHGTNILIGERARITGGIVADEVVVRGQVQGSLRAKRVMLQASSHVEGDILHQSLSIEQGAFFEGKSRRSDDPTAGISRPELPPMSRNSDAGSSFPLPSST